MGSSIFFLPVETAGRELDSRLMIASHLTQNGVPCFIGPPSLCSAIARRAQGGVYLHNRMTDGDVPLFKSLVEKNVRVVAIDDEILNTSAFPDTFTGENPHNLNLDYLDSAFCSTPTEFEAMANLFPNSLDKIRLVGNPRLELLSPPFRSYLQSCLPNSQKRGDFVLIATNFVGANLAKSYGMDPITHAKKIFAASKFRAEIVEKQLSEGLASVNWEKNAMKLFVDAIRQLLATYPEIPFVVRPHPSEEVATWKNLLASFRNVTISKAGSAVNWLASARLLIHPGSTVALEAHEIGIPTAYLMPAEGAIDPLRATANLPKYYGPICHNYDELTAQFSNLLAQSVPKGQEFEPTDSPLNGSPSAAIASAMVNIIRDTSAAPKFFPHPAFLASISTVWEVLQLFRTAIGRLRNIFGHPTDAGSSLEKFAFQDPVGTKRRFSALSKILHQDRKVSATLSVLGPRSFLLVPSRPLNLDSDGEKSRERRHT